MQETPLILDGRAVRDAIRARLKKEFTKNKPTLAIVQVGDDSASSAYIRQKMLFGESVGARVVHKKLPNHATERDVAECIDALAADRSVSGIIVQLPLPPHLEKVKTLNLVPRGKDVDGLTDGSPFVSATARGVYELLAHYGISVRGKKVAVFGRSLIAGGPIARLLTAHGAEVMVIHSQTPIEEAKRNARASDIVVVAIGKPQYIGREYFRDDRTQVVVDVGINRAPLVGDVDFDAVKYMVAAISPVPGGVGPLTVAALFENLRDAIIQSVSQVISE